MNKVFDENKISTFKSLKDLATGNKLVGRREIIICIDERAIEELRNYIFKADMFDEYLTAKCDSYEKYWKQANRDIQAYEKELREYVASLLYDNDYKSQKIEKLNNIIDNLKQKNNLAENILYDYLYNDNKITKEKYEQFKELKEGE